MNTDEKIKIEWDKIPEYLKKYFKKEVEEVSHFAVYPTKLIETPIKAGCPKGGIVLDPFMGAGTTGVVARQQEKNYIGIELNPEYIEIAKKRIARVKYIQTGLFDK